MATQTTFDLTQSQRGGIYVWQPPGKNFRIELKLSVVDGLVLGIMRGFGAVPRKGVEVGGILLGTYSGGASPVVRIDDFEPFPCQHRAGPAFDLASEELQSFRQAVEHWEQRPDQPRYVVGFYRSHLREGLSLSEVDLAMYDAFFPDPKDVVLIVKPFATKPSVAGFFFREDEAVQSESSHLEFPFRRRELSEQIQKAAEVSQPAAAPPRGIVAPPPARSGAEADETDGRLAALRDRRPPLKEVVQPPPAIPPAPAAQTAPLKEAARTPEAAAEVPPVEPPGFVSTILEPFPAEPVESPRRKYGLAAAALLLGLFGGIALSNWGPPLFRFAGSGEPYSMKLSAGVEGGLLQVRWDRKAAAIRDADSGALTIDDSGRISVVKLTNEQLRSGSVTYQHNSPKVKLRLEVTAGGNHSVSEALEPGLPAM